MKFGRDAHERPSRSLPVATDAPPLPLEAT